ncbi:Kinesin-like protein [Mycena kentingensis (nom. inval.)]|nr:Kinesin-like protein [Mycena kentingensis (nom. inval.)]
MSSTPATKRATPFTPRTTRSTTATERDLSSRTASKASASPVVLPSTHKKYKAALSTEVRSRKGSTLPSIPGSPTKSRPASRAGSRMGGESDGLAPMFPPPKDVEESLVDYQTVGVDYTGDADFVAPFEDIATDKVMVSVRVRSQSEGRSAWTVPDAQTIHPSSAASNGPLPASQKFTFDKIHTANSTSGLYTSCARPQVHAFMQGFNAVCFAYGQTASGKTYTLSGTPEEPGIIPRALRDIFAFIRATPEREYLLRCSYLEIYNETIYDLLAPAAGVGQVKGVEIQGGSASNEVHLVGLREEVVTSLANVREVLRRGEGNRRTASTDWNERSSRSHSVFRIVCESRERGERGEDRSSTPTMNGRHTPGLGGRQTPGPRLQAKGGRSVQSSVLSLIDLAGSEKATSDKERTKEGRYINTSLLTLGTVISTLAENAAKGKSDHVPYRNSKLTRMLQPSLSGNARISVVCTINPDMNAVTESMSTLQFARRIKGVHLNAQKKEIVDTDALIERYRKEIEDLKRRLSEREEEASRDAPNLRTRRLSAREQIDESKAMTDLNARIKQLTKLILTSQTVGNGDESRPASPVKIDFDASPYQLQQELLAAKLQLESQSNQILSLEASLLARPEAVETPAEEESEKDKIIAEQARMIRDLEAALKGSEEKAGAGPVREAELEGKLAAQQKLVKDKEAWAAELTRQLEKERKARIQLEEERRALAAFVSKFDSLGLGLLSATSSPVKPSPGGASAAYANRKARHTPDVSPIRMSLDLSMKGKIEPSLLEQMPEEEWNDARPPGPRLIGICDAFLASYFVMVSTSGLADIVALSNLISAAVQDVVKEYGNAELPPLSSSATGPFDNPEDMSERLVRAIRTIEGACAQLSATVAPPAHTVLNKAYGLEEPICIQVVADAKIADLLLDHPDGLHVNELSSKTGLDEQKLTRILRLLATSHMFTEVKPNVFANNRLSMKMVSTAPVVAVIGHMTDELGRSMVGSFNANLKDPATTSSTTAQDTPFTREHGCTVFEYYARRFHNAMIGWGEVTGTGMLPYIYPWADLPADTRICDVGGGNGHVSTNLLEKFPHLKVVVQDLPKVVETGRDFLAQADMDAGLKQKVEYVPLDFFSDTPVPGCEIYYIRHVLHDWPVSECKTILDNVRKAAKPTSRIFIHELVLQPVVDDGSGIELAPAPLLPNYGVGRVRLYAQDINMMNVVNSQERTLSQFIELGAQSGLKFVKLWDRGEVGLMEFQPI